MVDPGAITVLHKGWYLRICGCSYGAVFTVHNVGWIADPDPTRHIDADLDPTFHFNTDPYPDPALHQSDASCEHWHADPPRLHFEP
jgi:hypothetical protein